MALATSSKIAGRNLVKSWIPLVAQHRCYNGDNLQERNRKPNTAPNFVKIGLPKWWHETAPDIQFRKGFWKYIFPMPFHYGDEDPGGHYTRYRRGVIPQKNLRVMQAEAMMIVIWWWILFNMITDWGHIVGEMEWIDPFDFTDEELGIPPEEE